MRNRPFLRSRPSKLVTLPDLHRQVSPLNPACFKLQIQISRPSNAPATEATAVDPGTNLNLALHGVSQSGNFVEIMLVAPETSPRDDQYTLRRTTVARGATTGRPTTTAPPGATQPALYTPRAQTTALASTLLNARKPATSKRDAITNFMTVLLELRRAATRGERANEDSPSAIGRTGFFSRRLARSEPTRKPPRVPLEMSNRSAG